VAERDADLLAAVLEHEDVLDVREAAELPGAVAPDVDEVADVLDGLRPQRRVMVRRVTDDLASTLLTGVRGETVLEDRDVVVRLGDLGLERARPGRAERAVVRRRMVGAVLAPRRDGDPFLEKRVPAELAQLGFLS
jgi:hypothetical protein